MRHGSAAALTGRTQCRKNRGIPQIDIPVAADLSCSTMVRFFLILTVLRSVVPFCMGTSPRRRKSALVVQRTLCGGGEDSDVSWRASSLGV